MQTMGLLSLHIFIQFTKVCGGPTRARILLGTGRRRGGTNMNKLGLYPPTVYGSMVETNVYTQVLTIEAKNVNTGTV